jgi:hypothetical protein
MIVPILNLIFPAPNFFQGTNEIDLEIEVYFTEHLRVQRGAIVPHQREGRCNGKGRNGGWHVGRLPEVPPPSINLPDPPLLATY